MQHGAVLVSKRILERNWRFDTATRSLTTNGEVLRLREDSRFRITYKRPLSGTLERREIEFEIDDVLKGRLFFEALGYEVFYLYEKYRETFELGEVEIVLDEVPYGSFVEIEGPSTKVLQEVVEKLSLAWDQRVTSTYLGLFNQLRDKLELPFSDATFDAFSDVREITSEDLGLTDAFEVGSKMESQE